ncbi:MAG: nucleotidyltransferase domain-containing protein [Thermotogota bacterium]|nr:nucleotidyltransferase domain-containing protein [Thermotogota bacterium]
MGEIKDGIGKLAEKYKLQIVYAFGSRAKEALNMVEGKINCLSDRKSDLDIGIKPEIPLNIEEKIEIALEFEDIFNISRVDLVTIPEASVFLALEIVKGELLYAKDDVYEAEYQLYIMQRASELIPYERMKQKMILGF